MKAISRFLCLTVLGLLAGNGGYALTKQLHVQTAGTLPLLIQEAEQYEITALTLTGTLNGTDLRYLRHLAGGDDKGGYTPGKLTVADLGGTRIVAGGEAVYDGWRAKTDTLPGFLFYGTKVERIVLPAGVWMIERGAFCACHQLTSVTLPQTLQTIGRDAFASCSSLTTIQLPENLKTIEQGAFGGCEQLNNLWFPEGLRTIGYQAFHSCLALTSATLPSTLTQLGIYAFNGCTALKSVVIPAGITKLDRATFQSCTALTNVSLPATLDTLGVYCFAGCTALASIQLPAQLTTMEWGAFASCIGLLSITLPEKLDTIPYKAFAACIRLQTVTLPDGLKAVKSYAFDGCGNIERINLKGCTPPDLEMTAFDNNIHSYSILEVPYGCAETYRNHPVWGKFTKLSENIPTHVTTPVTDQPEVTLNENNLTVQTAPGQAIRVYTTDGRLLHHTTGTLQATLQAGIYVIRTGQWTRRVAVR